MSRLVMTYKKVVEASVRYRKKLLFKIVTVFVFAMLVDIRASAFSNSNFKGGYAFRLVGPSSIVLANESHTVATGVIHADGKGHVTGHGSFRSAGITCVGNISGIYNVTTDGTGLMSSIITTSTPGCFNSVLDLAIALSNNGKNFDVSNTENDYMAGNFKQQ